MVLNALTFELRIFLRKKRIRLEEHKKGIKRVLLFSVPSQEAKSGQPLAPILGQVQVNVFDFCNLFNSITKDFPKGSHVFIELIVNWDKTFSINIKPFPMTSLISSLVYPKIVYSGLPYEAKNSISLVNFYQLSLIYQAITGISSLKTCVRSIYGVLSHSGIAISSLGDCEIIQNSIYFLSHYSVYYFILFRNLAGYGIYNYTLQYSLQLLEEAFNDSEAKQAHEKSNGVK